MKDLGTLAGGTNSIGQAVNAAGQVAGASYFANGTFHAFLSDASGGTLHDLGTLGKNGTGNSYANGVNDKGQVVGYSTGPQGTTDAFVYSNGKMVDLNALISSIPGVHLTEAMAISNSGDIVAAGHRRQRRGVLVPAPGDPGAVERGLAGDRDGGTRGPVRPAPASASFVNTAGCNSAVSYFPEGQ